ncbi:rna-binding protein 25 [Fagus crenata]
MERERVHDELMNYLRMSDKCYDIVRMRPQAFQGGCEGASDHGETAKEKCARYATSTTIDGIDLMVSQNEVSFENFEVEESDQMRAEIYAALEVLDLEPTLVTDAYIFLMDNAKYKDTFFGCPVSGRKDLLLKLMSKSKN